MPQVRLFPLRAFGGPALNRTGAGRSPLAAGPVMLGAKPLPASPPLYISGVTRDNAGAPLGGCAVELYRRNQDQTLGVFVERVISDGSGNFRFSPVSSGSLYQQIAYLPGSPGKAGISVQTVVGV